MDDTDTATVELSQGEAREVINALSAYEAGASGRDEERALNVERLLQREFGFEKQQFEDDRGYLDTFSNIFTVESDEHEVELSRPEAREILTALDGLESREAGADAETIGDLRGRFAETFDLGADRGA